VTQIAGFDVERTAALLERHGAQGVSRRALGQRIHFARRWLEEFAPEEMRFTVAPELPPAARALDATSRRFLAALAERLVEGLDGEAVHAAIYELARSFDERQPRELFEAIYLALLGRPRGPRAGSFIAWLGPSFCATRFREAAAADAG
jgi:lysyl-tRNA synthetase class 1